MKPCSPSCTVVVCTRDRPAELERCLTAVAALTYRNRGVLVVDSASCDAGARDAAIRWGASYLRLDVPGLSLARNAGAQACDTEFVAYLDDDAVPEPEWLRELMAGFDTVEVVAVGGRVRPSRVRTFAERLSYSVDPFRTRLAPEMLDRTRPRWFTAAAFGGVGTGNNMAFRRDAFKTWSGFDARLGRGAPLAGGEELYAFAQLVAAGGVIRYMPTAVVRHPYPARMEALRARRRLEARAAVAYVWFLFLNQPEHRAEIARFVWRGVWRRTRGRLSRAERPFRAVLSKRAAVGSLLWGSWLGWRTTWRQARSRS